MTKNFLKIMMLLMVASFNLTSCFLMDYFDDDDETSQEKLLKKAEGIIELNEGIGDWDAAYLTKLGYFCTKEDAGENTSNYSTVTFMPADGSDFVSLLATKNDHIPTQMVTKKGTVFFSFPNDTILELVYDDGKKVEMIDSIRYSKQELKALIAENRGDAFKATLAAAGSLLNDKATRSSAGEKMVISYGRVFEEISGEMYVSDDKLVSNVSKGKDGNYEFTQTISKWYDTNIEEVVCNTISLWTGKATFKVGGSSCTLSGTIWCPSNQYNYYGTYGILCDENPKNLEVGMAEYEGKGYQSANNLSFSVDFRGFKPNTTYYYRAFYQFNSYQHGNIVPAHGNQDDQVFYDTTIKSFTTGDNILTVDVVMCIDVTGSMSSIINTVKRNAMSFYDSFKQSCDEENIQLAALNAQVIAYRDCNVDYNWLDVSPTYSLPDERDSFNYFVERLNADGGGDTPESGLEALLTAFNKSDWGVDDGYHRQVVILWTDAPYLIGSYAKITLGELEYYWNVMPSGRRLILFAPYGSSNYNGASWGNLDGWTNLIHEDDLYTGFNNFDYILKSIIGELTSKSATRAKGPVKETTIFRPNF